VGRPFFEPGPLLGSDELHNFFCNPLEGEIISRRKLFHIFDIWFTRKISRREHGVFLSVELHGWQAVFLTEGSVECCGGAYPPAVQEKLGIAMPRKDIVAESLNYVLGDLVISYHGKCHAARDSGGPSKRGEKDGFLHAVSLSPFKNFRCPEILDKDRDHKEIIADRVPHKIEEFYRLLLIGGTIGGEISCLFRYRFVVGVDGERRLQIDIHFSVRYFCHFSSYSFCIVNEKFCCLPGARAQYHIFHDQYHSQVFIGLHTVEVAKKSKGILLQPPLGITMPRSISPLPLFTISTQAPTVRLSGEITMEISTRFVGTRLKDYKAEITWRHTMNYAAAIDDNNPWYFDDEREGGIIAPPMFSVAVTWPIVERIWDYIEADDFPMDLLATQVHYSEHLEFHRPMKPEGSVTVKGKIAAILSHRAGTHVVIRFDAVDDNGLLLFTEHIGAIMRGVKCVDDGEQKKENLPEIPLFKRENPLWEVPLHLDPLRSFVYDGCSNIFFPIHTSKRFAHQVGLPGIIIQGTATLAFAVREIINREAGMNPQRLQSLSCRFTGMVLPGTDITVQLEGKDEKEDSTGLFFSVFNQEGKRAISGGYALLRNG